MLPKMTTDIVGRHISTFIRMAISLIKILSY